jgi:hypothetical protein
LNIAARLKKLEQRELDKNALGKVCFVLKVKDHMWIREYDFFGTCDETRAFMEKNPQNVYIVDDITHPDWNPDDYDGQDLETWIKERRKRGEDPW